ADALALDAPTRLRVLAGASAYCFGYIDVVCEQLVDEYESERDQWLRGAAAVQAETVRAILAGADVAADAASEALGRDVTCPHRALVVWRDAGAAGPAAPAGLSPATVAR